MLRTVGRVAAVTTAVAAAALALAAPAQASKSDCQSGRACLWTHAYYNGTGEANPQFWQWPNSVDTLPSWIDNQASSAMNNGNNCRADFYTDPYHQGDRLPMYLKDFRDNLALDARGSDTWNDVISSLLWRC